MKNRVIAVIVIVLMSACSPYTSKNQNMSVVFFNVGQADSSLIITPDNKKVLIDCGRDEKASEYLKLMNITMIDAMVITHPDIDHSGGCYHIKKNFDVRKTLTNKNVKSDFSMGITNTVSLKIIVAYDTHRRFKGTNDNSVLLKLRYKKISFLFTGDCSFECESELAKTAHLDAAILKVSHHGSRYSTTNLFLEKVKPSLAVISTGENSYGHPHNDTLERLNKTRILRTDLNGTIIITTDGLDYWIN